MTFRRGVATGVATAGPAWQPALPAPRGHDGRTPAAGLAAFADVGLVVGVTPTRLRPWLVAILLAALAVRLAAIVATGPSTLRFGDAQDYVDTAAALCKDGRYPDRGSLPFFRAPGLPFFLAAATACHPRAVVAAKLALALCDVATAALTAALVLLLVGDGARRAALLAAGLVAIDPFLVLASSDVTTEPLATLLLTAALCALLRTRAAAAAERSAVALACAGGVALGLASLTRPGSLAVTPAWLLLPVLALPGPRAGATARSRRAGLAALTAALALAATLAPWTLRNWQRFGEPILVNDAGGYNAWRGTHPNLHAMLSSTTPARFADASRALETASGGRRRAPTSPPIPRAPRAFSRATRRPSSVRGSTRPRRAGARSP
jgi:4-amino-4-deoxy-L-arabinose transferase-like glycosyltransferase